MNIISHRGFAGLYPENSSTAIQQALELGVDRIEIDVHQSKDGIIVLMHDASLNRTSRGTGLIKNHNHAQIAGTLLRAGRNEKIPTLETVLQQIQGKTNLLIEVKKGHAYYPNIEQHLVNLIQKYQAEKWCIIQSFDGNVLHKIHTLTPYLKLHKLLFAPYFYNFNKLNFIDEISVYYRFLSKKFIRRVHDRQKKINAWTVNDDAQMQLLLKLGIDGIITDRPDLLKQLLNDKLSAL